MTDTDIYPVGVLATLLGIRRALTTPVFAGRRVDMIRRELRKEIRYLAHQSKDRNWRAVRNSFNGYLAEHRHGGHNCGSGWTKRSALRRAERICKEQS